MGYNPDWTTKQLTQENAGVIIDALCDGGIKQAAAMITFRMLNIGASHGKELAREAIVNRLSKIEPDTPCTIGEVLHILRDMKL